MRRAQIPVRPFPGDGAALRYDPSRSRAVGHRDVAHVDGSCGRWRSRCRSCRPRLWEIAAAMLLVSTGAVGDNTRYVAHVFRRVAGHLLAVTRSYLDVARRWCGCGRWHSARCRRLLSRCRAPVGRYPIVVGTFLDAARVWEMPRGPLPTSFGALPGPCWPLPGRSWYASSRAAAVGDGTRHVAHVVRRVAGLPCAVAGRIRDVSRVVHAVSAPVLHAFFLPPTSGVPTCSVSHAFAGRPAESRNSPEFS
jgi:hypothetical protein